MIVVITDEAAWDIESIGDHIAQANPLRALSFVQELRVRCEDLARFPEAFPVVPRYEVSGVRRRVHGNYLIFYRVRDDVVSVIRVLHGAMDYEPILFPDP
jgi:toxin ParE1/3/4